VDLRALAADVDPEGIIEEEYHLLTFDTLKRLLLLIIVLVCWLVSILRLNTTIDHGNKGLNKYPLMTQ
jgi:hypothetical protein